MGALPISALFGGEFLCRDGTGAWDRLGTTALVWEAVVFHFRHPGLDPGSTAALRSWTPDQVRGDDDGKILPVAKRWGGGPSPQAMVEGQQPRVIAPPSALRDRKSTRLNSSHYCAYRMPSSA